MILGLKQCRVGGILRSGGSKRKIMQGQLKTGGLRDTDAKSRNVQEPRDEGKEIVRKGRQSGKEGTYVKYSE